jgi:hypothetical protein
MTELVRHSGGGGGRGAHIDNGEGRFFYLPLVITACLPSRLRKGDRWEGETAVIL